ncbi:MAG: flagellar assembly protein FliW [Clostridiales bacterium]|nr:flagellar assembly protein FliW [Clostridiales bacterium]
MIINSTRFGTIEADDDKIITFDEGLPGFSSLREFLLIEGDYALTRREGVFWWLQSVEDAEVAFALLNVPAFMSGYNPNISNETLNGLGDYECAGDFLTLNIAVIPGDITRMRVNLRAPVVINSLTRKGRQVIIQDGRYEVRHLVFDELRKLRQVV